MVLKKLGRIYFYTISKAVVFLEKLWGNTMLKVWLLKFAKKISKKHQCDVITLKKAENVYIENVNYFPILTTTSDTKVKMLLFAQTKKTRWCRNEK